MSVLATSLLLCISHKYVKRFSCIMNLALRNQCYQHNPFNQLLCHFVPLHVFCDDQ